MLRTVGDQPTLWESLLPAAALRMPVELERVDALLDDVRFFEPYRQFFHASLGRPSIPMETYLRLMFLKSRYRLGYEALCREVADSITWQRFCRIPLGGSTPHPTTLMKITTRCGETAVAALNEALLAKAVEAKVLKTNRLRADTTVMSGTMYPAGSYEVTPARPVTCERDEHQRAGRHIPFKTSGHSTPESDPPADAQAPSCTNKAKRILLCG